MANTESESRIEQEALLKNLQDRAERLISELTAFQSAAIENGKQHEVKICVFLRGVESEAKSLKTIARRHFTKLVETDANKDVSNLSDLTNIHALKSSNLPFYEAVWETAKTRTRVSALGRRVHWIPSKGDPSNLKPTNETKGAVISKASQRDDKSSVLVDVVAEDGLKWIKVSNVSNKRLLLEMAKAGWETYGDYSSADESSDGSGGEDHGQFNTVKLEVVQLASSLYAASRAHRVRFTHPSVEFIFTHLKEFVDPDVDAAIADMRRLGVSVLCLPIIDRSKQPPTDSVSLTPDLLDRLLPSSLTGKLTQDLNLDCTILLALISDISHYNRHQLPLSPANRSGTYHAAILRQIDSENVSPLLPNGLYSIICRSNLFCTSRASERMYEIVNTMGTVNERLRADIFLGRGRYAGLSSGELQEELLKLSNHTIPDDLRLPIEAIDFTGLPPDVSEDVPSGDPVVLPIDDQVPARVGTTKRPTTPSTLDTYIASKLHTRITLSSINRSVFIYGWNSSIFTLTSNKVVAMSIIKAVNELLDEYEHGDSSTIPYASEMRSSSQAFVADGPTTRLVQEHITGAKDTQRSSNDAAAGFQGPKIYICETARSLVGKEKQVSLS